MPAKIMCDRLNGDSELNMSLMMVQFEHLFDQLSEFWRNNLSYNPPCAPSMSARSYIPSFGLS